VGVQRIGTDREGELTECPCVTRELDVRLARMCHVSSSHTAMAARSGEPQPAQPLLRRDVLAAEGEQRPSQGGRPGRIALRDQQRQAVQEQVGGACRAGGAGAVRAALATSPTAGDRRPTNSAAVNASR
jgi:hypothetical protein